MNISGNITLLLTNPIWVAKTRLCLQYESQPASYGGFIDVLRKTFLTEGIRGLYKGFLPGIIGTSHGALQFMAYEELKATFGASEPVGIFSIKLLNLSGFYFSFFLQRVVEHLCFAALSKVFAVCSTYPYQVVRARLQDQHANYAGIFDVVKKTWRREGMLGFYKGLLPSILRVTPATCVTFVVYEKVSHFLIQARSVQ
ncbi:Mito carr domain containing protein [Trichuris trichiura]|uniref:Mito carr domain containing protein n=1 Tax=Trichuris trichiura TaxID=36087 RepID=A0A077ZD39_TRITR|nr:Mito carr domain containing protein [Trichuris trichiura]